MYCGRPIAHVGETEPWEGGDVGKYVLETSREPSVGGTYDNKWVGSCRRLVLLETGESH